MSEALSKSLGSFQSTQGYFENDYCRSNSIQPDTAFNFTNFGCNDTISDSSITRNDIRNSNNDSKSCARACTTDSVFHFSTIFSNEKQRKESSNIQFKGLESIHGTKTFSPFPSSSHAAVPAARRLDGQTRYQPGVLSYPYKTSTSTIPAHQLRRSSSSNDLFAVRLSCSPEDVCINHELDRRGVTCQRNPSSSVPGRLLHCSSGSKITPFPSTDCSKFPVQPRMVRKFREIHHYSEEIDRISGHHLGHTIEHKVSDPGQDQQNPPDPVDSSRCRQLDPQAGATPLRASQLCDLHHPPGKVALPCSAAQQQSAPQDTAQTNFISRRSKSRIRMVARKYNSKDSNTYKHVTNELHSHRCFGRALGSSSKQQEDSRNLEQSAEKLALQSQRNVCSDCRHVERSCNACQLEGDSTERQQDGGLVHQERGRNEILNITEVDQGSTGSGGQPQCCTRSSPPPRSVQYGSRQPLAQSRRLRVASKRRGNVKDLQKMGNSKHRSVRLKNSARRTELCYTRLVRLERLLSRRVQQILAIRPCLGVSSAGTNPASTTAPQHGIGPLHNGNPEVEEAILAPRCEVPSANSTNEDPEPADYSGGHCDGPSSRSHPQPADGSMAHFGWDTLTETWSSEEKKLLSSCWRPSTLKTYAPIWTKWSIWCRQNNVTSHFPKPSQVARYLAHLYLSSKLAYRTILVHKSTIASVCETVSNVKISSSLIVKHILKAISLAKPVPLKVPIWDARIVINHLKNTFPSNTLYDISRRTATILLLTSGRRVHDLSLLHCDSDHFIDNIDSITLFPMFGSKTDSSSYQQSSWTLLASPDRNTDPVFWLRTLEKVTKDVRGPITNLFITTKPPVRPAKPTVIGGWVKSLLKDAGIHATPGSCRSAVSSLNWIENYPISEILAKANWQHECTFRKFYHKQIRMTDSVISEKSLSQYFSTPM